MFGFPSLPAIEAMLMIRPDLRAFMPPITARLHRNTLFTSMSMTRRQSSSERSSSGAARPAMPALFTRMSIGP